LDAVKHPFDAGFKALREDGKPLLRGIVQLAERAVQIQLLLG
jgi:hypothetical protein